MSRLEEFGPYLLLKKLSEDSLGETFRAGRVGQQEVQEVLLLRVFNGRNINGAHLWNAVRDRRGVQEGLKSPNIGLGTDLGEVRGIPYIAYDYISGKNLSDLLVAASSQQQPMPVDHALLAAERIALALAMAYETRFEGQRVSHGFVVPHLIMVSSEGETRLLGFEVAPGLTGLASGGAFSTSVTRYLAPEALAEGQAQAVDDTFSLGVILYELLTCQPLPPPEAEGYGPVIRQGRLGAEGEAIPADLAQFLESSLAPRGQRIADAATWHKELSKIILDGQHTATTFNLAFFMHNLFRHEIERESEEIEAEKTIEIPTAVIQQAIQQEPPTPVAAVAAPAAAAAPAATATTGSVLPDAKLEETGPVPVERQGGKRGLWIGLAAAAALIAAAALGLLYWNQQRTEVAEAPVEPPPVVTPATEVDAAELEPEEPAGPTPEEIQAQLADMIDSRSEEMEAKLRSQYDERIARLQNQLTETQDAAAEREAELEAARQAEADRIAEEERIEAERVAAEEKAAEEAAAKVAAEKLAQEQAAAEAAAAEAAAKPEPPKVRLGELVRPGAGVTPPKIERLPDPNYPAIARRLNKQAVVEVRLLVDETGRVTEAETVGEEVGYGFEQAALEAARRARYTPAKKNGVRVKMYTNLTMRFTP
ncbi:MAG: TonB family protein [Acidobacteriota bacterium]